MKDVDNTKYHAGRQPDGCRFSALFLTRASLACLFFVFSFSSGYCQGLYIARGTNFYISSDTLNILLNVSNSGNLGSGPAAVIRFGGLLWLNDSAASLPDEGSYLPGTSVPTKFAGKGGLFWMRNDPVTLNQPQLLNGGYAIQARTGPSFPNLHIDNGSSVFLSGAADAFVRNTLSFTNGKLWLNGHNLLVGTDTSGTITGYSQNSFIVTGVAVTGGFLYRARLKESLDKVPFPIGFDTDHYAPLAIKYYGTPQDFRARVFQGIYSNAVTGTQGNQAFVQATWNIGKELAETADADLYVQHPKSLEGSLFAPRNAAYITRYNPLYTAWDTIPGSAPRVPGSITTGVPEDSSYENIRNVIAAWGTDEYLSKTVNAFALVPDNLLLLKNLDTLIAQPDGSFQAAFSFLLQNRGTASLDSVTLSDNISKTFASPVTFSLVSLTASGRLVPNLRYDGLSNGDTLLLANTSTLVPGRMDTVRLVINLNLHSAGYGTYYNRAYGRATVFGGSVLTQVSSNGLDTSLGYTMLPTPVTLYRGNVRIPGGFSPNGDGINDKFVIANAQDYTVTVEIYNRWGSRVYKSPASYLNDWDGKSNQPGVLFDKDGGVPDGTYFYIVRLKHAVTGVILTKSGSLTIRR